MTSAVRGGPALYASVLIVGLPLVQVFALVWPRGEIGGGFAATEALQLSIAAVGLLL
jgi:hypothetical protein